MYNMRWNPRESLTACELNGAANVDSFPHWVMHNSDNYREEVLFPNFHREGRQNSRYQD